jgi:hypothetical protein
MPNDVNMQISYTVLPMSGNKCGMCRHSFIYARMLFAHMPKTDGGVANFVDVCNSECFHMR